MLILFIFSLALWLQEAIWRKRCQSGHLPQIKHWFPCPWMRKSEILSEEKIQTSFSQKHTQLLFKTKPNLFAQGNEVNRKTDQCKWIFSLSWSHFEIHLRILFDNLRTKKIDALCNYSTAVNFWLHTVTK